MGQVAVLTGVLAALTGFLTVRMTTLTNQAIYESGQAILSQTEASDAWSEYQAESIKAHIVEMQILPSSPLNANDKAALRKTDEDFRDKQTGLKQAATGKIAERDAHLQTSTKHLAGRDILGYASMAAQMGIALASVAALVHKRPVFYAAAALGGVAVMMTAYVFMVG